MKQDKQLRYIAYIRKSEERSERQELSHPAQKRKIKEQFLDLKITEWVVESQSAFKPGRQLFDKQVMQKIENGEADGIIAYHPNRLSRNEIDSARITYALRSYLKDLKFCSYSFENTSEGIWMLQNIMNHGQYESSKQGRDVKRGMEEKALGGERPGQVAIGYIKTPTLDESGNAIMKKDKIVTHTVNDPDRYDLVAKMWSMFLSGVYTTGEIRKIANEEWGFRTRPYKKRDGTIGGNIKLSNGGIYRILTNPFYAGIMMHNGVEYKGGHEAMITLEQFDYAQKLLGKKGKPRVSVNDYAFTGLMKCGECGCSMVGKTVDKKLSDCSIKTHIYYHCTRKSEKRKCGQIKYTTLKDLEADIDQELANYTILPEFRDMALDILKREHKRQVKDRNAIYKSQERNRRQIQSEIDELVMLRTKKKLSDDAYERSMSKLENELEDAHSNIRQNDQRAKDWVKVTEKVFDFAANARTNFANGDSKVKRDILMTLGESVVVKDNQLFLEPKKWFTPIKERYPEVESKYLKARTKQKAASSDENTAFDQIFESWRAIWDSNPGHQA